MQVKGLECATFNAYHAPFGVGSIMTNSCITLKKKKKTYM